MEEGRGPSQPHFLWAWGAGTDGQLGTGTMNDQLLPQPIALSTLLHLADDENDDGSVVNEPITDSIPSNPALVDLPLVVAISRLACGGAHTIALTSNGRVLTWGRGVHGQLGHGLPKSSSKPRNLKSLENYTVISISAGWNHSGFVTDDGRLLTCGDGSFGQLGHGSSRNSVYSFGSGRHGQLGISLDGTYKFSLPQMILAFEDEIIDSVYCNGDHSAALSSYGQLYVWGRSFYGNLKDYLPTKLPLHLTFSQVVLGWNHALLLADGEVYMVGGNLHGKLSHLKQDKGGPESTVSCSKDATMNEASTSYPIGKITGIDGGKVVHIAAGSEHSVLVTESGKIMTWGWGEHGQLGLGSVLDQTIPQVVDMGMAGSNNDGAKIEVYCGSGFTFAMKTISRN